MTFITPDQRTSSSPNGNRLGMPAHLEALINKQFKKVDWRGSVVAAKMADAKEAFVKRSEQEQRRRNKLAELELLLKRAKQKAEPLGVEPEPEMKKKDPHRYLSSPLRLERLSRLFCDVTGAVYADMIGRYRGRAIVDKRHMCMWLLRQHSKGSYPIIGRQFGGRDHSTVIQACKRVNTTPELLRIAREIERTVLKAEHDVYAKY